MRASALALCLLCLGATSGWAQDAAKLAIVIPGLSEADPTTQMTAGFAACLKDFGNAEAVAASFTGNGWTRFDRTEESLVHLEHPTSESTFADLATDGSFCQVESLSLTTGQAGHVLALTLQLAGVPSARMGATPEGCITYTLDTGVVATITSGGQDPVCTSQLTSAIRFEKPATP